MVRKATETRPNSRAGIAPASTKKTTVCASRWLASAEMAQTPPRAAERATLGAAGPEDGPVIWSVARPAAASMRSRPEPDDLFGSGSHLSCQEASHRYE